jgi:hypothetical protein
MSTVSDDSRQQQFTDQKQPTLACHPRVGYPAAPLLPPELAELSETDPPGHLLRAVLERRRRRLVWGR